ncbi:MAG: low molecular weight phosphotyrosine protein phosphatase [Phycisphaerales bacterium]|nr:low molecular weight phosphotyrosine protein phosphatase [Phycisphaerales bacterium]
MREHAKPFRVLFVCMGNICRSPTAEGVFRKLVRDAGLDAVVEIDSAGTGSWHVGSAPDRRTQSAALKRGLDLSDQRARRVSARDFELFDLIVAMDRDNLSYLEAIRPGEAPRARLMLEFSEAAVERGLRDVPDPYSGGEDGFEVVLDLIEGACEGLLEHVRRGRTK